MPHRATHSKRAVCLWLATTVLIVLTSSSVSAQQLDVKPIIERKIAQLPPGQLFWRIDTFPTLAQAQSAASSTSLAAEAAGQFWLFTLGLKGGSSPGGSKVAEIGPVPPIAAPEYLLRINISTAPPGGKTPIHTHPGSESFYVVTGELSQKTPHGTNHIPAGQSMVGHEPGIPMEVFSSGTRDLTALVMFVVDATKPFSSPGVMP